MTSHADYADAADNVMGMKNLPNLRYLRDKKVPQNLQDSKIIRTFAPAFQKWRQKERCSSGLRGTPGKRVYVKSVSGVRIPLSPQSENYSHKKILQAKCLQDFFIVIVTIDTKN